MGGVRRIPESALERWIAHYPPFEMLVVQLDCLLLHLAMVDTSRRVAKVDG